MPVLLWFPAAFVAAVMLLPLVYLAVRSVAAGPEAWQLLLRPRTLEVLLRTTALAAIVTTAAVAIALPLAWLTVRTDLPFRRAWTVLAVLPLAIPTYVGGFVLVAALGPRGILQQALAVPLGVDRLPEIYGLPGAALALTLFTYPYLFLSLRAGLRGMDPSLEEASRSLGYGRWDTFRRVTLPQMRPSLAAGSLLVALYALSDFGVVSLLQFDSFTRVIYQQYQGSFDRTSAALLGLALVALTALILFAEGWSRGRGRYHRGGSGAARADSAALGRWRWPAVAFCSLVALWAVVLPAGVLTYWLARGVAQGIELQPLWSAAWNSAYASALAALVAAIAALPLAILMVRFPGRGPSLLERITYAGFALPGIVVALALVFFGANYATPLYQTLALLVVAYVVRFLPQSLGSIRSSLLRVSPSMEEAARGLGRGPARVIATVTLPLVRPGLLAGFALVFLTAMKELPATLLLSPIGFKTLATITWTAAAEGFFAEASASALTLLAVSGASMVFVLRADRKVRSE